MEICRLGNLGEDILCEAAPVPLQWATLTSQGGLPASPDRTRARGAAGARERQDEVCGPPGAAPGVGTAAGTFPGSRAKGRARVEAPAFPRTWGWATPTWPCGRLPPLWSQHFSCPIRQDAPPRCPWLSIHNVPTVLRQQAPRAESYLAPWRQVVPILKPPLGALVPELQTPWGLNFPTIYKLAQGWHQPPRGLWGLSGITGLRKQINFL